jgi:hypothetical protein
MLLNGSFPVHSTRQYSRKDGLTIGLDGEAFSSIEMDPYRNEGEPS